MKRNIIQLSVVLGFTTLLMSCKANGQEANRGEKGPRGERPSIEEIFKKMDVDEDGLLSKKEVKGPLKNDFTKIDANEDGFLSKEEIEKAPKPKREKPQGRQ